MEMCYGEIEFAKGVPMLSRILPNISLLALALTLGQLAHARSCGTASYYGPGLYGQRMANGQIMQPDTMVAAHPSIRLNSWVRVVNTRNGRSVNVKISDRGPYYGGRIIDVSETAAYHLGMVRSGLGDVCIYPL